MPKAMRDVFGETLCELKENPKIVVLDADLGSATRALKFKDVCPERFLDIGIAEQNMVGIAAGLSTCDMIPIATTFSVFITGRAFDQVRNTVAHGNLNVKLVGTHNGVCVGYDGATHEAVEDIALMRSVPNMVVLVPADAKETEMAIKAAIAYKGPVYLRISRIAVPDIHGDDYKFCIGKGEVLRDGTDVAIISTGIMTSRAIEAAEILLKDGVHASVVNICSIKPIDRKLIVEVAKRTKRIVTVEEHTIIGGLGSAVSEILSVEWPVPIRFVGINDEFGTSGAPEVLLEKYKLTAKDIIRAVKSF
ncbi:transketolase family protein [Pectinatus cerevisiiphilus]|uniref:Transketolase subunit B n=1 Tax=Pectinatus cerevisiiphilus TaxID=86956 RepID=A0A4R3KAE6_9FIRM|nr:transketolase family protein [Pectinatus cerevisiiphilus]TCS79958.1 transketolase subunit B [Pectinatus cerevisiiphilus]